MSTDLRAALVDQKGEPMVKGDWFRYFDGNLFVIDYVNINGSFGARRYDPVKGFDRFLQGGAGFQTLERIPEPSERYADPEWLIGEIEDAHVALDVNGYSHPLALRIQLLSAAATLVGARGRVS